MREPLFSNLICAFLPNYSSLGLDFVEMYVVMRGLGKVCDEFQKISLHVMLMSSG